MKVALITGITGITSQDGAYPAAVQLDQGYEVHRVEPPASPFNTDGVDHFYERPDYKNERFKQSCVNLTEPADLVPVVHQLRPDEIGKPPEMRHMEASFKRPELALANVPECNAAEGSHSRTLETTQQRPRPPSTNASHFHQ